MDYVMSGVFTVDGSDLYCYFIRQASLCKLLAASQYRKTIMIILSKTHSEDISPVALWEQSLLIWESIQTC